MAAVMIPQTSAPLLVGTARFEPSAWFDNRRSTKHRPCRYCKTTGAVLCPGPLQRPQGGVSKAERRL